MDPFAYTLMYRQIFGQTAKIAGTQEAYLLDASRASPALIL